MNQPVQPNDLRGVIEADRNHLWHHLSQHKQYETVDPRVIVEGRGMKVWGRRRKRISTQCLEAYGP